MIVLCDAGHRVVELINGKLCRVHALDDGIHEGNVLGHDALPSMSTLCSEERGRLGAVVVYTGKISNSRIPQ